MLLKVLSVLLFAALLNQASADEIDDMIQEGITKLNASHENAQVSVDDNINLANTTLKYLTLAHETYVNDATKTANNSINNTNTEAEELIQKALEDNKPARVDCITKERNAALDAIDKLRYGFVDTTTSDKEDVEKKVITEEESMIAIASALLDVYKKNSEHILTCTSQTCIDTNLGNAVKEYNAIVDNEAKKADLVRDYRASWDEDVVTKLHDHRVDTQDAEKSGSKKMEKCK